MFLAVFFGAVLLVALCTGRNLLNLANVRFTAAWLFPLALLIQFAIFNQSGLGRALSEWLVPLHITSYLLLFLGMAVNIRLPGFIYLALGELSNFIAIAAHKGYMPVVNGALKAVSSSHNYVVHTGSQAVSNNSSILSAHSCMFDIFADTFVLPSWFPMRNVFSIGDVFLGIGAMVFVWRISK